MTATFRVNAPRVIPRLTVPYVNVPLVHLCFCMLGSSFFARDCCLSKNMFPISHVCGFSCVSSFVSLVHSVSCLCFQCFCVSPLFYRFPCHSSANNRTRQHTPPHTKATGAALPGAALPGTAVPGTALPGTALCCASSVRDPLFRPAQPAAAVPRAATACKRHVIDVTARFC